VVGLTADLLESLQMQHFKKEFPERFFQVGIAGSQHGGYCGRPGNCRKNTFHRHFCQLLYRTWCDQIRQSVAYSHKNVKICASHAGLTLGEDGATHQILEDVGMMRMLPGMVVINPCDYNQTKAATLAVAEYQGPVYLRFGRPAWPVFTPENQKFTDRQGTPAFDRQGCHHFCHRTPGSGLP
jgi:transketolase